MPDNMFTLKLDMAYRPVDVIDSLEALVMCLVGRAKSIEFYDEEVRSPKKSFKLPAVIVIFNVVKESCLNPTCTRKNILRRDLNTCQYCAKELVPSLLTIDHLLPRSRGGENTWENLVAACKKCNQRKGNRTPEEAGMKLINKPTRPRGAKIKYSNCMQEIWKDYIW
jgi:5-methylcytosine-specific restriction endonuclease McrA